MTTTWSWPSSIASRVCSMKAATSEARKYSPSPTPTTSGEFRRAATTGTWPLRVDRDERERPVQPAADRPHGLGEVEPGRDLLAEQVRHDLGVGLGDAGDAVLGQLGAQGGEVLDDAVVDDGDPAVGGDVRVGVDVGRAAVGGPAGVPDPEAVGGQRVRRQLRVEVGDLARLLRHVQAAALDDGDAGGVVPAVLQAPQALDHDPERRPRTDVADDSAHAPEGTGARGARPGTQVSSAASVGARGRTAPCRAHYCRRPW